MAVLLLFLRTTFAHLCEAMHLSAPGKRCILHCHCWRASSGWVWTPHFFDLWNPICVCQKIKYIFIQVKSKTRYCKFIYISSKKFKKACSSYYKLPLYEHRTSPFLDFLLQYTQDYYQRGYRLELHEACISHKSQPSHYHHLQSHFAKDPIKRASQG